VLLKVDKFKGIMPRIADPSLLPDGEAQFAQNCRFDFGGVAPYYINADIYTPTVAGPLLSIFRYYDPSDVGFFLSWPTDVDAVKTPLAGDIFDRVFYIEGGILKVTDKDLYNDGGTDYPEKYKYPSPPAPINAPIANGGADTGSDLITNWVNGSPGYNTLTHNGTTINAVNTAGTSEAASTNNIAVTTGQVIHLVVSGYTLNSGAGPTISVSLTGMNSFALANGDFYITANANGNMVVTATNVDKGNWLASFDARLMLGADPTLLETRAWCYTYVNGYGEEGPPSPVSNFIRLFDGNVVTLTNIATYVGGDAALYNITYINIYRVNQGVSSAQFQFVAQITAATTSYVDALMDAALGEILMSTEWDGLPSGSAGLTALANGVMAAFVDNILCLSPAYYPHAWPVSWQKYTDRDIVAVKAIGTTAIVLTKGQPYAVIVNDPSNTNMERIDGGLACVSKRSAVQVESIGIVAYASPEGLMTISNQGAQLVTAGLIDRSEWDNKYNPSTISAYYWQGKYVAFYTNGHQKAGFIFDFGTNDLVDLDMYATGGYHDPIDGRLYLIVNDAIVSFSDTTTLQAYTWVSKRFRFKPSSLKAMRVYGETYPATIDIIFRDIPATITVTAADHKPVRLPKTGIVDSCDVRVYGKGEVSAIYIASTIGELPL
jgi:hypothetical protein